MIRVGQTYFKNTDFIYYAMEKGIVKMTHATFHAAHPPKLGEMLFNNEIDIAPVSSIIYGQRYDELLVLPDFSISAYGETGSILLLSEDCASLEDLEGRRLAVPGTSASSSALVEILLKSKGIDTEIIYHKKPELKSMLQKADAALLIGDDALIANSGKIRVMCDLGEEWKALTGKKMVYALWIIRKEFAEHHPNLLLELYEKLSQSRRYAYENLDAISRELAEKIRISSELMKEHLLKLDYGLDRDCEDGLKEYFDYAHGYGILKDRPEINYFKV